jgi:hypothetical protein
VCSSDLSESAAPSCETLTMPSIAEVLGTKSEMKFTE